jgi:hypothetical protein
VLSGVLSGPACGSPPVEQLWGFSRVFLLLWDLSDGHKGSAGGGIQTCCWLVLGKRGDPGAARCVALARFHLVSRSLRL